MTEDGPRTPTPEDTAGDEDRPLVDAERLAILNDAFGPEKLRELFATARQSVVDSVGEMRANWAAGNSYHAGRAAHRLAGVAANFGLVALAALATDIERDCLAGGNGQHLSGLLAETLEKTLEYTASPPFP